MVNKIWTVVAQFDTFAEANNYRNELAGKHDLIKVKRGKNAYRVKIWDLPVKKKKTQNQSPKIKLKKGDNSRRKKKNENKKVRN